MRASWRPMPPSRIVIVMPGSVTPVGPATSVGTCAGTVMPTWRYRSSAPVRESVDRPTARLRVRGRSRTCAAGAPGRCRGPGTGPATAIWSIQPSPGNCRSTRGADQLVSGDGDDAHPRLPARRGDRGRGPVLVDAALATLPVRERVVDQVEERALLAGLQQAERDAERRAAGAGGSSPSGYCEDPRGMAARCSRGPAAARRRSRRRR